MEVLYRPGENDRLQLPFISMANAMLATLFISIGQCYASYAIHFNGQCYASYFSQGREIVVDCVHINSTHILGFK